MMFDDHFKKRKSISCNNQTNDTPVGKLRVRLAQGVFYHNNNRIIQFPKQNEFGGVAARAAMLPHVTSAREAPPLHQLP